MVSTQISMPVKATAEKNYHNNNTFAGIQAVLSLYASLSGRTGADDGALHTGKIQQGL